MAIGEYTEIIPGTVITTAHNTILMRAYKASNLLGAINFISAVPANLPIVNNIKLADKR